jgi:hypothetical protein
MSGRYRTAYNGKIVFNLKNVVMKRVKIVYTIIDYVVVDEQNEQDAIEVAREVSFEKSLNDMECVDVECFIE